MSFYAIKKFVALLLLLLLAAHFLKAQCPTLNTNASFTSSDCAPGSNPCALCPGESFTLTPTGTNLQNGDCINWYYGTTNNFNPYNGEGTLLGCSAISGPTGTPCNPNPYFVGILVDACGTEQNNEYFTLWSGGGFDVNDLTVDYDINNNIIGPENDDIGGVGSCGWQMPSAALLNDIQADCGGATIVGVGPGQSIPPYVPVLCFTSSGYNGSTNFSALCAVQSTIYVVQSNCLRSAGAFTNTGVGMRSTTVSIGCWSSTITYDQALLPGGNGAFVGVVPVIGTNVYGNAGCNYPTFPPLPSTPATTITPLTVTVDNSFCNGGPYYVVGVYEPLPGGCSQVFTNYLSFDVPCPMPTLGTADICSNITSFDLNTIEDPMVPNGVWSGPGVSGNNFNATGLSGAITLTFTPSGPCGTPATTDVNVVLVPGASIAPVTPICPGGTTDLVVSFTGDSPWDFELWEGAILLNSYSTTDNPFLIPVMPGSTTTYSIRNLSNGVCTGPNASVIVSVSGAPSAQISNAGPSPICEGQTATLSVNFTGGQAPYTIEYAINGDVQAPINATSDPFIFQSEPLFGNSSMVLVSVTDFNGCVGNLSGEAFVEVNPAPTASIPNSSVTVCAGAPQNIPVTLSGGSPYNLVYAINGVNQPPVVVNSSPYNIVFTPASGSTSTITLVSVSNAACPGIVEGSYTLTVGPPPTAVLSGGATICPGQSATLTIDLTGSGTFTINYTANGIAQTPIMTTNDPFSLIVSPASVTNYVLTGVSLNGCTGTVSGSAIVGLASPVSAVLSGGGQICQGASGTTLSVAFNGPGPYTFVYASTAGAMTTNSSPITTSDNPYTFTVNPTVGTTYQLVSLNNATCSGAVSGSAVVFVFTPPSAAISGSNAFCNSADTSVIIDFTGTGPFTFNYTKDGITQAAITTFDDPYILDVVTSTTTTYSLVSVESPGCTGTVSGSATITINTAPSYANLNLNCNAAQNNYVVSFDVLGAALPLTLTSGSGSFTGNQFTSTALPQASGYSFSFHDANNCGTITVTGLSTCNCVTDAGTMLLTPIQACISDPVTATHNNNFVNDGNDALRFILHDSPALPLGTIYAWSTTPTFSAQPGMMAGQTYYISAIAGNPGSNNEIDQNDLCLSVSQGTPVTFNALPSANMGVLDTTICAGQAIDLTVNFIGSPPFSFAYASGGVQQTPIVNIASGSYVLTLNPTQNTLITLDSIADNFCDDGLVSGTADIKIFGLPTISTLVTNCDFATGTYTVTFDVLTGTAPFSINGLSGSFTGNTFTSLPIPFASSTFSGQLRDANNCGEITVSGQSSCNCTSNAGTMSNVPVSSCTGNILSVPPTSGSTTDSDDILVYVMRDAGGLIIAWSAIPDFLFVPPMQAGIPYTVSAVVGNPGANGEVDLNDPCHQISNGVPVQWTVAPTASISGNYDACPGVPKSILVTLSGTPPFQLTYTSNGSPVSTPPINSNAFSIFANLIQTTTYVLTGVQDANCPGTVSGQAVVTVHPVPALANAETVCSPDFQTYTLEFDVTQGDLNTIQVTGVTGNFDPASGHFTSDPIPTANTYSISVSDIWGCGTATATGMADCACQTDAGMMGTLPIELCNGLAVSTPGTTGSVLQPGDTLLYYLVDSKDPMSWTVLATNNSPSFTYQPGITQPGTTYYIVAVAGPILGNGIDLLGPCVSIFAGPSVRWRVPVTAALSGDNNICPNESFVLNLALSGDGPYQILYTLNGVLQTPVSTPNTNHTFQPALAGASNNFALVSVTGAGSCPGTVSGAALVTVSAVPQAVNIQVDCDLLTSSYTLIFDIANGAAPNPVYTVNGLGGTLSDTTFTSIVVPSGTIYNMVITDPNGCSSSISGQPECKCKTSAGSLTPTALDLCTKETAVVTSSGNFVLDPEDKLMYILYTDPLQLPASIIGVSAQPQFNFGGGMTVGTTYYISAIAGDSTALGTIDPADPCISLSPAVPVIFYEPPTASVSKLDTLCPGSNASFDIAFTGTAPFIFNYTINGVPAPAPFVTAANPFTFTFFNIQANQDYVFELTEVEDAHCSNVASGQAKFVVLTPPEGSLSQDITICKGDTATLNIDLNGGVSYDLSITGAATPIVLNGVTQDTSIKISPTQTTTYAIGNLTVQGNDCPAVVGTDAEIKVNAVTFNGTVSDYNGFGVSCPNSDDGFINLTAQGGTAPYGANWDSGQSGLNIQNLLAGAYQVTVSDQIGCTAVDSFTVSAPLGFDFVPETESPRCYGDRDGSLNIPAVSGGIGPFSIKINDNQAFIADTFPQQVNNLAAGDYTVVVTDANGCSSSAIASVIPISELTVDLGLDTTIHLGDSLQLEAIVNSSAISQVSWSPLDFLRVDSLLAVTKPLNSIKYSVLVIDSAGCRAEDQITVTVRQDIRIYVPNIFNPLSSEGNDFLSVFAGDEVVKVRSMRIYDRWGEMLFFNENFAPNQPQLGWDGRYKGKYVNPGVYIYVIDAEFIDGRTRIYSGDVTVVR